MANQRARVELEGIADLKAALEELDTAVATRIGVNASRKAANRFKELLIEAAPYDPREKKKYWKRKDGSVGSANYGHLRDDIRVRKLKGYRKGQILYVVRTMNAFWGWMQEAGTVNMPARPWWRPTFDANVTELIGGQISELRNGIERQARRVARLARRGK